MERRRKGPECIEPGCGNRCPERTNFHTMTERMALEASLWHHRCERCHAGWAAQESRAVKGRKDSNCLGCGRLIPRGEKRRRAFLGTGMHCPERAAVCDGCYRYWLSVKKPKNGERRAPNSGRGQTAAEAGTAAAAAGAAEGTGETPGERTG